MTTWLIIQAAAPLLLLAWLALAPARSWLGLAAQAVAALATIAAVSVVGLWIVQPWWTPWLLLALFAAALAPALARRLGRARAVPSSARGWIDAALLVALAVFAGREATLASLGRTPPSATPTVDLSFPLSGGTFLVLNGGYNERINAHLHTLGDEDPKHRLWRGQSYGLDIVAADAWGGAANGVLPRDPKAWAVYGAAVSAPCSGTVRLAVDGLPDRPVPEPDLSNRGGNHVLIACRGFDVLLAHLAPGSVRVQAGQTVAQGQPIGRVGNSGASDAPHLHVHAQTPGTAEAPYSGAPLGISFEGRRFVRGHRVRVP